MTKIMWQQFSIEMVTYAFCRIKFDFIRYLRILIHKSIPAILSTYWSMSLWTWGRNYTLNCLSLDSTTFFLHQLNVFFNSTIFQLKGENRIKLPFFVFVTFSLFLYSSCLNKIFLNIDSLFRWNIVHYYFTVREFFDTKICWRDFNESDWQ